ncbi:hypothetical protein Tco_1191289 [Tanacetum coccineum]
MGCQAFSGSVIATHPWRVPNIENLSVVRVTSADCFSPHELIGLSSGLGEIKFGIELTPVLMQPSQKAPYRRPPVNLMEFKGANAIIMDPPKVKVVTKWPRPTTVMEVRSFLGLAGYYRRFVEGFSRLAFTSLPSLMSKIPVVFRYTVMPSKIWFGVHVLMQHGKASIGIESNLRLPDQRSSKGRRGTLRPRRVMRKPFHSFSIYLFIQHVGDSCVGKGMRFPWISLMVCLLLRKRHDCRFGWLLIGPNQVCRHFLPTSEEETYGILKLGELVLSSSYSHFILKPAWSVREDPFQTICEDMLRAFALDYGQGVTSTVSPTKVSTAEDITMAETLVYIRRTASKDKGKGKMDESKPVKTKTKLQQEQERLGYEAVVRLQAKLEEEERQRIAKVHEVASSFNVEEWEYIQARVEADEELAQRFQAEEREKYIEAEQARMLVQLRGYSFDEIKTLFKTTMRRVKTFVPIESEVDRAVPELAARSSKRDAEEELDQGSSKRQNTSESSELDKEQRDKEADQLFTLKALGSIGRSSELEILLSLVKEKFNSTEPTDDKEREIWVELKRLFEPDTNDELWKLQKHIHDLSWKLYDSCGVHNMSTEKGIDIYMLVEKEYPLSRGTLTLMLGAKLLVEQDNEMSKELLWNIFLQAERPRR